MPDLPIFYYANGTAWAWNWGPVTLSSNFQELQLHLFGLDLGTLAVPDAINVKGLDGKTHLWTGGIPNDVFPQLLDTDLWQYKRVPYPAQMLFIGPSIVAGAEWVINQILSTPVGTPFALGGYSQGAAVMSRVYQETRSGRLVDRRQDLRQMITFGNPMRETNHTWPGSSGYSGACDIPGSTRGGHGSFPAAEDIPVFNWFVRQFARLVDTESHVWDFTMPNEVIGGVGDSDTGKFLANGYTLPGLSQIPIFALIPLFQALPIWNVLGIAPPGVPQNSDKQVLITDAVTGQQKVFPGGGHIMYPFFPPPNADGSIPTEGDTCYQVAARQLRKIGQQIYDELHPAPPNPANPAVYSWSSTW